MIFNILFSYIFILGLYYDSRIKLNRKFLIILIFIILWLISIYIDKVPYLIIKDLFWYSLVLNGSFIIHVLILSWIYRICWLNKWEYICFVISRISFIFSLSFIVYLLHICNYILFSYIDNKKINLYIFLNIIYYIINVINLILRYFIIIFHNYVIFLMGLNEKKEIEFIDNIINKYKIFEFIVFTLSISIIIGYPRLYIIWIFYFLKKGFDIYIIKYNSLLNKEFNFFKKLNSLWIEELLNVPSKTLYKNIEIKQIDIIAEIYKKPYYNFFMFDLFKFLFIEGKYIGCHDIEKLEKSKFPLKTPFKFYSWIEIMKEYYNNRDIVYEYFDVCIPSNKYYWRSVKERYDDLMRMCEDINLDKSKYNLISDELPEYLTYDLVKNQDNFYLDENLNKFILKKNIKL